MNRKQAYWTLYLLRFDFTVKHIPKIKIKKVKGLSRRLDWKTEMKNDDKNQKLIKQE